jgi:SET domain-containing protein
MTFLPPFQPNCNFEDVVMHPRFGYIMGLVAKRDIIAGEEITVDYNYKGSPPRWFAASKKGLLLVCPPSSLPSCFLYEIQHK